MIKEWKPPFLYKTHSIIEEKIKTSSSNLLKHKFRLIILLIIFNTYLIHAYIIKKNLSQLLKESYIISPVIFFLFFYHNE